MVEMAEQIAQLQCIHSIYLILCIYPFYYVLLIIKYELLSKSIFHNIKYALYYRKWILCILSFFSIHSILNILLNTLFEIIWNDFILYIFFMYFILFYFLLYLSSFISIFILCILINSFDSVHFVLCISSCVYHMHFILRIYFLFSSYTF